MSTTDRAADHGLDDDIDHGLEHDLPEPDQHDHHDGHLPAAGGPVGVAVRHDVRVPALVALGSAVLTVLWFARALGTGSWLDWVWCVVPAFVGTAMLLAMRDSRAPLLVADDQGVRVRRGVTWSGVRWSDVERVEVRPRGGVLRDGALVVHVAASDHLADHTAAHDAHPADDQADDQGDDQGDDRADDHAAAVASGVARVTRPATRFEVPLGLGTRVEVEGLSGDLAADLDLLAAGQASVVVLDEAEVEPDDVSDETADETADERASETFSETDEPDGDDAGADAARAAGPVVAPLVVGETITVSLPGDPGADRAEALPEQRSGADEQPDARSAEETDETDETGAVGPVTTGSAAGSPFGPAPVAGLEPGRAVRGATRSEVVRETVRRLPDPPAIPVQRGDAPVVTARLELETPTPTPVADPVIGPVVAAARHRARLTIDTLSERTRIRPHVLECLEVDDFAACGGDFYARGHIRTLARVFGLDAEELVGLYDARYAGREIEARQVFEAELASGIGGGLRTATTGPRWSVLAAAVLVLVVVWAGARIFSDPPEELVSPAPDVVDSAGLAGGEADEGGQPEAALAAISFTAEGAGSQVVVRDMTGRILWVGRLADGQSQQVIGKAPFDVTASNGQAVRVSYLGKGRGTVGDTSAADNRRFGE